MKRTSIVRQYVDKREVSILTILAVISAGLLVGVAYMTRLVVESIETNSGIIANVLIAVSMLILYAVTLGITNYLTTKFSMISTRHMVTDMHAHLLRSPMNDTSKSHSMERLKIVAGDSETAVSIYVSIFPKIADILIKLIAGITLMMVISYEITLIAIAIGILVCLVMLLAKKPIKALHKCAQSAVATSNAFMQETMKNAETVKMLDMNDYVREGVSDRLERVRHTIEAKARLVNVINSLVYLLLEVAFLFVLVYGGVLISRGQLGVAEFVALVGIIEIVKAPFMSATTIGTSIFTMLASEERVKTIYDLGEQTYLDEDYDAIVLEHVSYSYDTRCIIHDLSLNITKGSTVVLSGYSGVGKSTLLRLILGILEPTEGDIYVVHGDERIPLGGRLLRAGYLPQGLGLMNDTIRQNLTYGKDVDDETIESALRTAGIYDDVMTRGMDSVLSEGGDGLSEGQKQRVALARAIIRGEELLVLDEPFSALDKAIAMDIYSRLKALGITLIIASHDDFVLEGADRVVDMGERT